MASRKEGGSHHTSRYPPIQGPKLHGRLVSRLGRQVETPERQARKENERSPQAVETPGLIRFVIHVINNSVAKLRKKPEKANVFRGEIKLSALKWLSEAGFCPQIAQMDTDCLGERRWER